MIINKFLEEGDYDRVAFKILIKELEAIRHKLREAPNTWGSKLEYQPKLHWSRDWELPWAIINSEVKSGERILDCGCGNSSLLPLLQRFGCEAYGSDPYIFDFFCSYKKYYLGLITKVIKRIVCAKCYNENNEKKKQESPQKSFFKNREYRLEILKKIKSKLCYRKHIDPNRAGFKVRYFDYGIEKLHFPDNFFDKVFCISVIEHLPKQIAYKGMREMGRVLKPEGLLIVTVDNDGLHINPELINSYEKLISESGLKLFGNSDFAKPDPQNIPGIYNVVGFILKK